MNGVDHQLGAFLREMQKQLKRFACAHGVVVDRYVDLYACGYHWHLGAWYLSEAVLLVVHNQLGELCS